MNLLFFLKPKSEVVYISSEVTLGEALKKMNSHQYTAIPLIDYRGRYVGTISEGDFLRQFLKDKNSKLKDMENRSILSVKRRVEYKSVSIGADMETLVERITNQNFVPVVDDDDIFIGIVTRKDIIQYGYQLIKK